MDEYHATQILAEIQKMRRALEVIADVMQSLTIVQDPTAATEVDEETTDPVLAHFRAREAETD